MKLALVLLTLVSVSSVQAEEFRCILESKVYKKSPVAVISSDEENGLTTWSLKVLSSTGTYDSLLKVDVKNKTDDVYAQFVNRSESVNISFYLDESDSFGLMEGAISSPVMNGAIRCLSER